eukprot:TRINITY_DN451_c0_g1_i1.p1 TRINITY_DN451_c0_g1~~TRINITY_DN451_c0_g1_i1.p1  ORF type:complete len:284 (-),score=74.21 TRINITY_DN451_c0_g1_i1:12-863(-)
MMRMGGITSPAKYPTSPQRYFAGISATNKPFQVIIGGQKVNAWSDNEGHIKAEAKFPRRYSTVPISITPPGATAAFRANAIVTANEKGVSVISDIDDTVKITQVLSKGKMVANTFAKPMQAVPGAANVFQAFKRSFGASFHYVSASPYRLTVVLQNFFRRAGLPDGTLNLKRLNLKNWQNFVTSDKEKKVAYKVSEIRGIITTTPKRKFILVGDSGEQDPEVYMKVHKMFPNHVLHVFIRQVPEQGEPDHSEAYEYLESHDLLTKFNQYDLHMVDEVKEALNH